VGGQPRPGGRAGRCDGPKDPVGPDWEKKQFAEAHQRIIGRKAKIAALIREHDPQYREYLHFEILFANLGVKVRIFDDERRAESWLLLPL
jgi:hypothetical protein